MGTPASPTLEAIVEELEKVLAELQQKPFLVYSEEVVPPALSQPKKITIRSRRRPSQADLERMRRAGHLAEVMVEIFLVILRSRGKVLWFEKSKKFDARDRLGIDFWGRLTKQYGGALFSIDAKSSLRSLKPGHGRRSVIFVPSFVETMEENAERLLGDILKRFGENTV